MTTLPLVQPGRMDGKAHRAARRGQWIDGLRRGLYLRAEQLDALSKLACSECPRGTTSVLRHPITRPFLNVNRCILLLPDEDPAIWACRESAMPITTDSRDPIDDRPVRCECLRQSLGEEE